jgi:hypothetical protein
MNTQTTINSYNGVKQIGVSTSVTNVLPKVKDATINIRDRVNDVLMTEKHNLVGYQVSINETIDDSLRNIMINNRNNLEAIHNKMFNELFNMGEYTADIASSQQIADTVQIFNNYKVQMPFK